LPYHGAIIDLDKGASLFDYDLLFDARWRGIEPAQGLTWGVFLEGRSYFHALERFVSIQGGKKFLEIGPGYGRLAEELFARTNPGCYVGLDLSAEKCRLLSEKFKKVNAQFVVGDCRTAKLDRFAPFDIVISSCTMEHIRPNFGAVLTNLLAVLAPGATVALDFINGPNQKDSEHAGDSGEFVRNYADRALEKIAREAGFDVVAIYPFDMMNVDFVDSPQDFSKLTNVDGVSIWSETIIYVHRKMLVLKRSAI
jgi:SAM-dependent methyltransferase